MASHSQPRVLAFYASAAIPAFTVVKGGADKSHVSPASAATDKVIGIAQNEVTASGDTVEVAIQGGGAKAKLGGTVAFGDFLASNGSGALVATTTADDNVIAQAMQSGVSGDVIGVEVVSFNY